MFRGCTFEEQQVNSKDDGGLYREIFRKDGILWGCEMTVTNTALTIQPGRLIISGREIRVDGATQIPFTGPIQNGYGQVVLTIDLSKTATKEEFDQVEASVVYSTTSLFPELTQGEINTSNGDMVYQQELAVVSIAGGNITGITRQIEGVEIDAERLGGQPPEYYKNDYLVIHGQATSMQAGVDTSLAAATVDVNDSPFVWDSGTNALWGDNTVPYRYARVHIDLSISGGVKLGFVSVNVAGTMINPNKSGALSYSTYFSEATGKSMMIGGDFFVALKDSGSLQFTAQQNGSVAQTAGMRATAEFIK